MIKKNWLVKALSLAMAIMMVVGIMAPAVSAMTAEQSAKKNGTLNYVSIGDSMTNGYGFEGYEQGSKTTDKYDFINGVGVYGEGSYANQFAEYLAEKFNVDINHTKLALSGLTTYDLLYLLGAIEEPIDDDWGGYMYYVGYLADYRWGGR